MSRFTKQITSYWQQFRTVVRNEYGSIFTDAGVILVLVLALLIYSTLYSLAYGTQVLRNVPIGVIDMSNTSTSRQLINTFNAGPNVYVAYEPGDMDEAKHLFYDREIYGVVYIPSDYEEKLLGGQQAVTLFYILGLHYKLFHFPTNGHTADIIAFLIPYLLSCIFLGIAVSTLFQRREQSIMLLLWCSIPALMLSGASVPREAMPEWLYLFGQILPSSSGVEGFIRIQSMGASFSDVLHEVRILWILTIVYGGFAAVGIHLRLKQAAGK